MLLNLPVTFKETIIQQEVCEFAEGGQKTVRKRKSVRICVEKQKQPCNHKK